MKRLLIFGAGGHARVVYSIAQKSYKIVGFVDTVNKNTEELFGYRIFHELSVFKEPFFDECIVAIGDNYCRHKIVNMILSVNKTIKFATLIDPTANINENVNIGNGTVLMPSVTVNICSNIGDHCIINTNASIDHECEIGSFASISPGVVLGGKVKIGKFSVAGLGSNIIEKVSIGDNVLIGAGSLVLSDIEDNILAYGVPAKAIRSREFGERYIK
jgi:sugar O-acyltransferase (sialic acid O-acetyltransferase NeuD family)